MEKDYKHTMEYCADWKKNSGALGFKMHNDYLFRALLQSDEHTLKFIIASAMGRDADEIHDIVVTNPILLGDSVDDKEIHLDVKTYVEYEKEKYKIINLEMQIVRHKGWTERSVLYVCRAYDSMVHGSMYAGATGVWQVSFCDFALFPDEPVFFSDFMLLNTKNTSQVYTDKIRISSINLRATELASEEDRRNGLVLWARLFKAESWEELKMLAQENTVVDQTISSVWQLTQDRAIREQMQRREENELLWESMKKDAEEGRKIKREAAEKERQMLDIMNQKDSEIAELKKRIKELEG